MSFLAVNSFDADLTTLDTSIRVIGSAVVQAVRVKTWRRLSRGGVCFVSTAAAGSSSAVWATDTVSGTGQQHANEISKRRAVRICCSGADILSMTASIIDAGAAPQLDAPEPLP